MKTFELIARALQEQSIVDGNCFACGRTPSSGAGEHVMPKWLLTRNSLWNSTITLLNGTTLPYSQLRVPCCKRCNNGFLSRVERDAQAIFAAEEVKGADNVLVLGRWMAKLLVGILTKETKLYLDRRDRSKGFIVDARFLDNFHLCHIILQTARKPTTFRCLHSDFPFSLYWYAVAGTGDDNFDFITDVFGNAVAIRVGRLAVVFVADGGLQMEVGAKGPHELSGREVSLRTFRELVIRIFYKSQLRDATHFYINSETPSAINVEQISVSPYTGLIPGTVMTQIFRPWDNDEMASVLANMLDGAGNFRPG
ncbi:hypothetical protein [Rhizobium leguminosarum]|uniref:hypothetical protein n=1 Tax=Rhizobium leguminosarum TaxID=384 RepID=UPI00167981C8|nr:hypothetical protein [Rhizobium leguminosarum]